MKKLFVMVLLCGLCMAALKAGETAKKESSGWEAVQIAFWDEFPVSQNTARVCGVRAGLPVCGGKAEVDGVEIGILWCHSNEVVGIQASPFAAVAQKLYGLQFSIVNWAKSVAGFQLGVVNVAKDSAWQFGLINIIKDSPLPFMILCNVKF